MQMEQQEAAVEQQMEAQELALELQHLQRLKTAGAATGVPTNGAAVASAQNALVLEHQLEMQKNAAEMKLEQQEAAIEQ